MKVTCETLRSFIANSQALSRHMRGLNLINAEKTKVGRLMWQPSIGLVREIKAALTSFLTLLVITIEKC